MFKGFFLPVDLVDSLIISRILLGEHMSTEMQGVKGRLAMANKFKLWLHLESINSEMPQDYTCCGSGADNLQGMRKKGTLFLFGIYWIFTFIQSHFPKIKGFICLAHFNPGLVQRFSTSWDFCLTMVPSNDVLQNWPGILPRKNATGRFCSLRINVK